MMVYGVVKVVRELMREEIREAIEKDLCYEDTGEVVMDQVRLVVLLACVSTARSRARPGGQARGMHTPACVLYEERAHTTLWPVQSDPVGARLRLLPLNPRDPHCVGHARHARSRASSSLSLVSCLRAQTPTPRQA